MRISILFKVMINEFKRIVHPNAVIPVRMAGKVVPTSVQSAILAYTVIYILIIIVGLFVNMGFGLDFLDSFGLSVSSVGISDRHWAIMVLWIRSSHCLPA